MVVHGVVKNGSVVLELPSSWSEGTRVTVSLAEPDDALMDDFDPGPETETQEEFLESLRQGIADIRAGVPGVTIEEFEEAFSREFGLPRLPRD